MTNAFPTKLVATAVTALLLSACGDAETTIVEKDPIIIVPEDEHDHEHKHSDEHDHGDNHNHGNSSNGDIIIESLGRLAVLSLDSNEAAIVGLDEDDKGVNDSFSLTHSNNRLSSSAGGRYAVISQRSEGLVEFIDSGIWREDHVAHLHDYKQAPTLLNYTLNGAQPTHIVSHNGQTAIFNDGNADTGETASVDVITDTLITSEGAATTLSYNTNMHGVAEPRGDYLLSTLRRTDEDSSSFSKILPDQVAVYHLHDGEYEQDLLIEETCQDLHGAAQNHEFVVFGCGDGILAVEENKGIFTSSKITNIEGLEGMRIGNIWGHEASESFIGTASQHGGTHIIFTSIKPEAGEIELLEWQPNAEAKPVSYGFSYDGQHFTVLDSNGELHILEQHEHDGATHWEHAASVVSSTADLSQMPEGASFSMTLAKNGNYAYIADPIAKHIVQVHLEDAEIEGEIELNFAPSAITWLGIAETEKHEHEGEDDHNH